VKLRTLALAGAALFVLTSSASAVDAEWYVGIGAGLNLQQDYSADIFQ
jgi:hypothetical protein